ncbi:hypothetical protein SAMN02910417_00197 [Eubacterium oxidoreducens]|uniref:Uncharacterized protein n=1 Tax=Eubacterium oxidoreducens TaxID=1732 RepID=A0A1G6A2T3_EUBOX|nr:hypothetical protein SAMN02910417_00197 [Eubacterium oxidoreducens]
MKKHITYNPYEMITEIKVDNKSATEMFYRNEWLDMFFIKCLL